MAFFCHLKWRFVELFHYTFRIDVSIRLKKCCNILNCVLLLLKHKKNVERWINCNQDITMPDRTTPTKITQSRKFIERTGWKELKIMTWMQWWYLFFEDLPFIAVISSNRGSILNKIDHRQLHDFKNNKQNVSSPVTSYLPRPIRKIFLFINILFVHKIKTMQNKQDSN